MGFGAPASLRVDSRWGWCGGGASPVVAGCWGEKSLRPLGGERLAASSARKQVDFVVAAAAWPLLLSQCQG